MTKLNKTVEISYALEQEKVPLLDKLKEYSQKDIACFDVPGHVRDKGVKILNEYLGEDIMRMDINSSPLMDNVANPNGIIKESQDLLAKAYDAQHAFFITNGTTQAIHAMILSTINPGDKILLPRNIHKSVINGLIISGGVPIYIQPKYEEELGISLNISTKEVKIAIEKNPDIKALFLLNPTYYGACSQLKEIVSICHDKDVLVLVDEAHGAHFAFCENLPPSAMDCNADMSAVSIHKTGGALTQASALLLNSKTIDKQKVLQSINMIQSTSASYLLMSSIDGARSNLALNGEVQLSKALNLARYTKNKINKIKGIKIVSHDLLQKEGAHFIDETKLCINVKELNLTGFEVYDLLYQEFNVQVELGDMYNILALISIGTTKLDVDKLIKALSIISKLNLRSKKLENFTLTQIMPEIKLSPRDAFYAQKESIELCNCAGRVSGEFIMAYPPGIPIISPGEIITYEIINYIRMLKEKGAHLTDMSDKELNTMLVVK